MNYALVDFHRFIEKSDRKIRYSKTNKQLIHKEIFLAKNHIFLACIKIIRIFARSKTREQHQINNKQQPKNH